VIIKGGSNVYSPNYVTLDSLSMYITHSQRRGKWDKRNEGSRYSPWNISSKSPLVHGLVCRSDTLELYFFICLFFQVNSSGFAAPFNKPIFQRVWNFYSRVNSNLLGAITQCITRTFVRRGLFNLVDLNITINYRTYHYHLIDWLTTQVTDFLFNFYLCVSCRPRSGTDVMYTINVCP